jgi:hypothetical protein
MSEENNKPAKMVKMTTNPLYAAKSSYNERFNRLIKYLSPRDDLDCSDLTLILWGMMKRIEELERKLNE